MPLGGYGTGAGQEASSQGAAPAAEGASLNLSGMQVGTDRPVLFHGRQWHRQAQGPTTWVPGDWQASMSSSAVGQPVGSQGLTASQVCIMRVHM